MRKPQCTGVHEDFRIKYNAESTLLTRPLTRWKSATSCGRIFEACPTSCGTGFEDLSCYVVIEVKIGEFDFQDLGQLSGIY